MAFTNKFILIHFILISFVFAQNENEEEINLPRLIAKQETNNIRFISDDGRYTYYQNRDGNLLLSTNYDVTPIISLSPGTQFKVQSPHQSEYLVIEAIEFFHTNLNLRNNHQIYLTKRGQQDVQLIGKGQDSRLHLQGRWVSFFYPHEKKIQFQNTETPALRFAVQLRNEINPYFIPEVVMLSDSIIIYTDIGRRGYQGILNFNRSTEEVDLLIQASKETQHIALCRLEEFLVIQEIGTQMSNDGSSIHTLSINSLDIDQLNTIYQSKYNDLGSLLCDSEDNLIYFVKKTKAQTGRRTSDVYSLSPSSQEIERQTNFRFVTEIIQMDQSLLVPFRDNIYVLKGQSDYTSMDLLQKIIEEDQKEDE